MHKCKWKCNVHGHGNVYWNRKDTPEGMALKTTAYSSADTGTLYFCKKSE